MFDAGTMLPVTGSQWIDKFSLRFDTNYNDANREGNLAITLYGLIAAINTGGAIAMWFLAPLQGAEADDLYWWTWFFIFVIHLIIWGPILLLWPLAYIGNDSIVYLYVLIAQIGLFGPFGAYIALLGALIVAIFMADMGFPFKDDTLITYLMPGSYFLVAGLSSLIQLLFLDDLKTWYDNIVANEANEEAISRGNTGSETLDEDETVFDDEEY